MSGFKQIVTYETTSERFTCMETEIQILSLKSLYLKLNTFAQPDEQNIVMHPLEKICSNREIISYCNNIINEG